MVIACTLSALVGVALGVFGTWLYFSIVIVGEALNEECCGWAHSIAGLALGMSLGTVFGIAVAVVGGALLWGALT